MAGPNNSSKPTTSLVIGGVYNATPPAPADGQAVAVQVDAQGNLKTTFAGGGSSGNVNLTQVGGVAISEGQKAMAASLPVVIASDQSAIPVSGTVTATPTPDSSPATQNITARDVASVSTAQANGQNAITGAPTAGSAATFTIASMENVQVQVTGTWTGTLISEISIDGGTTWFSSGIKQSGSGYIASSFTANFTGDTNVGGVTNYRVRATAAWTGTATVLIVRTANTSLIRISNAIKIADATTQSQTTAVSSLGALKVEGAGVGGTPAGGFLTVQGGPSMTALAVNVQTSVLPTGAALDASVTGLQVAQASTTSGQKGDLVQGAVTTGDPSYTTAQTDPLSISTRGWLRIGISGVLNTASVVADNQTSTLSLQDSGTTGRLLNIAPGVYGGAFSGAADAARQGWSKNRTSTVFKTVSVAATASGNTAVWTPGSGNKFRLLSFQITAQGLAATASAAITVSFQDATTGITIGTYDVDVPAVAGLVTGVNQISGGWIQLGAFGILSAAANQVLNFNISAAGAGTVGTYRVNVAGTEE